MFGELPACQNPAWAQRRNRYVVVSRAGVGTTASGFDSIGCPRGLVCCAKGRRRTPELSESRSARRPLPLPEVWAVREDAVSVGAEAADRERRAGRVVQGL